MNRQRAPIFNTEPQEGWMSCLRRADSDALQCDELYCKYRPIPIEVNPEYDDFPSPDDCVLQPRKWPKELNK